MNRCDTCGRFATHFHDHHVLPRSLGGLDEPSNIVTICEPCHARLHGLPTDTWRNLSKLIREGIRRRAEQGLPIGAVRSLTDDQVREMQRLRDEGWAGKDLAVRYGVSTATISRNLRRNVG